MQKNTNKNDIKVTQNKSIYIHDMGVGSRWAGSSLGFTKNYPKNRKYPVSSSYVGENALLMPEVKGEWPTGSS